ncbi:hypothetical protein [Clostridium thermobutyricum]|uniref:hypothetical protein n=1 Tax=Clostridium thermobutyricum TaxID=29372 RepID=UPI0018A96FD7|nr:hypothetical protein [Clostridium thermobutyricum]
MKELTRAEMENINGGNWQDNVAQVGLLANSIWQGIKRGANSVSLTYGFKNLMDEAINQPLGGPFRA